MNTIGDRIDQVIFGGLVISGLLFLTAYYGEKDQLLITSHFFGYAFWVAALVMFLVKAIMFTIGRVPRLWQGLCPVNFGLFLLVLVLFTPFVGVERSVLASFGALAIVALATVPAAVLAHRMGVLQWRWSPIALVMVLFIHPVWDLLGLPEIETTPRIRSEFNWIYPTVVGALAIELVIVEWVLARWSKKS